MLTTSQVTTKVRFIADNNVGKLAKLLRMVGYDTLFFSQGHDNEMIRIALRENRVILTKDTHVVKRQLVTSGKLKAILISQEDPKAQLLEVVKTLNLNQLNPFSRCLECNQLLIPRSKEEVQNLVPPYVFETQEQYTQCQTCHRIYWRGTHWQTMVKELSDLSKSMQGNSPCY